MPNDDKLSIATKICYFVTIMGSYVIVIQPVFSLVEQKAWYTDLKVSDSVKHVAFRLALIALTIVLSAVLPDIHAILALSGSVAGTITSVVVPVLLYNKAFEVKDPGATDSRKSIKRINWVVLVLGTAIGLLGLFDAIRQIRSPHDFKGAVTKSTIHMIKPKQ